MVKNWMLLGDEAFDGPDCPMGVLRFSQEEIKDWQEVAFNRFSDVLKQSEKVREMVRESNFLYITGLFYEKSGATDEQLRDLTNRLLEVCTNIKQEQSQLVYDSREYSNLLMISFFQLKQ